MIEGLSSGNANGGEAVFRNLVWAVERVNQRGGVRTAEGARLLQLDRYDSKGQIEEALYAFGSEIESNTVEVYVSRLRKKLGKDCVETLRGIGYRLGR